MQNAFVDSERKTDVEIALIKVQLPQQEKHSFIFDNLHKTENIKECEYTENTQVTENDFFKVIVDQYNMELNAGIALIKEYNAMQPYILSEFTKDNKTGEVKQSGNCILSMTIGKNTATINEYVRSVRGKYWSALFHNPNFVGNLTENLQREYYNKIEELKEYDFSLWNISQIKIDMSKNVIKGIEETGETITKEVDAYEMFHKMCEMNWDYAEPGMLFWDRINNWNLLSCDDEFEYAGTNPCAEEPLPAGGSCLLGSINLSEFVCDTGFDFDDFKYCVKESVIALNEVLDEGLPLHPLKEQRESVYDWRQIGLGIFGLADLLIKLGIKYGSPEAIDLCDMIGHIMSDTAIKTSALLAKDHGVYPKYKPEAIEQSAFYSKNALGETKELVSSFGLRNSQLLTIAPTGSLSTMLGVSGGIEPIFANYYTRKTESLKGHDEYYKVYTPIVKKYIDEHNLKDDSELPDYFVTAQTLDYKNRIYMQSIWQSHIDASISSTVNVPNDFTIEQVESLYMSAWESGLKGVTIFRDGCKRSGILTTTSSVSDINDDKEKKTLPRGYIVVADDNVIGLKRKVMSGCGSLHIVAMFDPITGELLETYISKGSTGGCQSNLAAVSRLISLSARAGVDVYTIADQLKSCPACPSYVGRTMTKHDTSKGKCCPDAIANALIDMYKEMKNSIFSDDIETSNVKSKVIKKNTEDKEQSVNVKNPCPVCGEELTFEGGCNVCKACGWSKCD